MAARGTVTATFEVDSSSSDKTYQVTVGDREHGVRCTCPAWRFTKGEMNAKPFCKHIKEVGNLVAYHVEMRDLVAV